MTAISSKLPVKQHNPDNSPMERICRAGIAISEENVWGNLEAVAGSGWIAGGTKRLRILRACMTANTSVQAKENVLTSQSRNLTDQCPELSRGLIASCIPTCWVHIQQLAPKCINCFMSFWVLLQTNENRIASGCSASLSCPRLTKPLAWSRSSSRRRWMGSSA